MILVLTGLKTFFRILSFALPIGPYAFPYFIFALMSTVFGLVNFTLLIPLLDVLFLSGGSYLQTGSAGLPEFSLNPVYFQKLFYYYLGQFISVYGKMGALQLICLVILFSVLLKNLFYYLSMLMREALKANVIKNARSSLFEKITSLHLGYFSNKRKGDLMSRMTTDVAEIEQAIAFSLDMLLRDPLAIIAYFIALFSISVKMTFFTLLIVPLSGVMIVYIGRKLRKKALRSQQTLGMILSILEETLGAIRIIKGYNAIAYSRQKFDKENHTYARQLLSIARTRELASPFSEFFGVGVVIIILLYGGSLVFSQDSSLSASAFVAYIILFSQVLTPAKAITTALTNIQRGLAAGERIFELVDTRSEISNPPHALPLKQFDIAIEFKNVSFRYENQWVLRNISFTIPKGKTLALVGETGSGKSTLADLLCRFYDIQEGEVLIDGINVKDLEIETLWNLMGIVSQDTILFNDSIYNNIAFAHTGAKAEEIENAAKIANAHYFITQTENGYQTVIGDRGMKLAGGQRQRITIARAVLKNPPILILDEATSALDSESERLVQEAIFQLMQHRTSLVIAHRLSTIQNADEILVLKRGEIVERGTHLSLMKMSKGYYRKLVLTQGGLDKNLKKEKDTVKDQPQSS